MTWDPWVVWWIHNVFSLRHESWILFDQSGLAWSSFYRSIPGYTSTECCRLCQTCCWCHCHCTCLVIQAGMGQGQCRGSIYTSWWRTGSGSGGMTGAVGMTGPCSSWMAGARISWRHRASALSSFATSSREGMLLNSASVGRSPAVDVHVEYNILRNTDSTVCSISILSNNTIAGLQVVLQSNPWVRVLVWACLYGVMRWDGVIHRRPERM